MAMTIRFTVFGKPQQRGSKQACVRYDREGQPITKNGRVLTFARDDNPRSKDWMRMVASAAAEAFNGPLIGGPVELTAVFHFARPKSHLRTNGELRDSAPVFHTQTPDLSKLIRSLEDSLTGVIWRDDRQVVWFGPRTGKAWTTCQAQTEITIRELTDIGATIGVNGK